MIVIHHAPMSRSLRVRWLCEELGLDYELRTLSFGSGELHSDGYRALNPFARVPTIEDGDLVLWESGAILQYLLDRYGDGRLRPAPGTPERARCDQWSWWSEATLLPPLGTIVQHTVLRPESERVPAIVPDAVRLLRNMLGIFDRELDGKPYVLGSEFSAADIMVGYSLHLANLLGQVGDGTNAKGYLERIGQRPAFQQASAN